MATSLPKKLSSSPLAKNSRFGSLKRRLISDPFAVLAVVCILGLFACTLREVGQYFYPYRWWFIVGLMVGAIGLLSRIPRIPYRPEHRCLSAFMWVGAISVLISPMPEYSFARLVTFIMMFVAVFIGGWAWLNFPGNAQVLGRLLVFTALIGVGWSLYFLAQELTSLIPGQRITGAFGKATGTGSFAAGAVPIILWRFTWARGTSRWFYGVVLAVLLYILIFSGARAAIVGGLAATVFWLWKHWRNGRPVIFVSVFTIASLFATGVLTLDMLPEFIVRKESLPTFTGRIPRWQLGLDLWSESPLLGHGYGMTRYIRFYQEPGDERLRGVIVPGQVTLLDVIPGLGRARLGHNTLHSDHVERLVEMGLLGYLPFALFWLFLLRRFWRVLNLPLSDHNSLAIAFGLYMSYAFLDSFMHGALFALNAPGVLVAWFAIAAFMAASDQALRQRLGRNANSSCYPQCGPPVRRT